MKTIAEVLAAFPSLKWRVDGDPEGSGTAYAVLGGNRASGEIYVFAVIADSVAPRHRHREGADYGEKIGTFVGELLDHDDEGNPVVIGPSDVLYHGPNTTHAPRARFWFGYYHQPRGSELVIDPAAGGSGSGERSA